MFVCVSKQIETCLLLEKQFSKAGGFSSSRQQQHESPHCQAESFSENGQHRKYPHLHSTRSLKLAILAGYLDWIDGEQTERQKKILYYYFSRVSQAPKTLETSWQKKKNGLRDWQLAGKRKKRKKGREGRERESKETKKEIQLYIFHIMCRTALSSSSFSLPLSLCPLYPRNTQASRLAS